MVVGFGSILLDQPLVHSHPAGTRVDIHAPGTVLNDVSEPFGNQQQQLQQQQQQQQQQLQQQQQVQLQQQQHQVLFKQLHAQVHEMTTLLSSTHTTHDTLLSRVHTLESSLSHAERAVQQLRQDTLTQHALALEEDLVNLEEIARLRDQVSDLTLGKEELSAQVDELLAGLAQASTDYKVIWAHSELQEETISTLHERSVAYNRRYPFLAQLSYK